MPTLIYIYYVKINMNNNKNNNKLVQINKNKLNPYYIAGLIHANGGFNISTQRKGNNIKLFPKFNILLDKKHVKIIQYLIEYFNTGYYKIDHKGICIFTVSNLKDLITIIIPFFLKYQIFGNKFKNFIMFKIICEKLYNKEHYKKNNQENIILYYLLNLAYHINNNKLDLNKYLNEQNREIVFNNKIYYQNIINQEIKNYTKFILNIDFIKGLFDINGEIKISLSQSKLIKIILSIKSYYKDDELLLKLINQYFNLIGNIKLNKGKQNNPDVYKYIIKDINNIENMLLPTFNNFNNGIEYNIKLYKLEIIQKLIEWMKNNKIYTIRTNEELIEYLKYKYQISNNNLLLNEYITKSLLKYKI